MIFIYNKSTLKLICCYIFIVLLLKIIFTDPGLYLGVKNTHLKFIIFVKGDIVIRIVIERAHAGRIKKSPAVDDIIPAIKI